MNYLRFAARLENELDALKKELCLRTDYCALDHFRCIDYKGRGYITESDLALLLRENDVTLTSR